MYGLNAVRVMLTSTSSAIATRRRRITSTVTGSSAVSRATVNVDLLELADREAIARPDQRARAVFLDQCGAAAGVSDRQRVAVEDRRLEETVFLEIEDRPPARAARAGMMVAVDEARELGPRHVQRRERVQHHELRVRRRIGMAVAPQIFGVEFGPHCRRMPMRRRNLERVLLASVANF